MILTAAYILWAIQRVYLGAEYKGPHEEEIVPVNTRELFVLVPLLLLAIWFGVYPATVFNYMDETIDAQVQTLADWSPAYIAKKEAAAAEAEAAKAAAMPATAEVARPAVGDTSAVTRSPALPGNVMERRLRLPAATPQFVSTGGAAEAATTLPYEAEPRNE